MRWPYTFMREDAAQDECVLFYVGYLKGKSALMIFDKHTKGGGRHFWYYVDTVGRDEELIRKYIKEQEEYDKQGEA